MAKLTESAIRFLESQGCVVLSTIDAFGFPHSACKDIIKIDKDDKVYLLDVYHGKTFENLKRSPLSSITAFNEHKFIGYCIKGKARPLTQEEMAPEMVGAWEERIASRAAQRLLKNLRDEKGHPRHPEASLPKPKYIILFEPHELVDLTPYNLR